MNFLKYTLAGRIVLSTILGFVLAFLLSEGAFLIVKNNQDRDPQRIELVIPAGTAERIAAGQPVPSIPKDMTFIVGDVLVVTNQDSANHQLGPVFVPAGASASLEMTQEDSYSYSCSFEPSRNLGIDVRARVTWETRLQALALAGPPMAVLIALYSLVVVPLAKRPATPKAQNG
jgi:hypothetical protein